MDTEVKKIFLSIKPPTSTQQQKGFNRLTGRPYERKPAKQARNVLLQALREYKPVSPYDSNIPLEVNVTWFLPVKDKKKQGKLKTTKPDLDNLSKMLLDVMTKLEFWHDDAQIVDLRLKKYYCKEQDQGILIEMVGIKDDGKRYIESN